MKKCSKVCLIFRKCPRTCESVQRLRNYEKICQNLRRYFKSWEGVPKVESWACRVWETNHLQFETNFFQVPKRCIQIYKSYQNPFIDVCVLFMSVRWCVPCLILIKQYRTKELINCSGNIYLSYLFWDWHREQGLEVEQVPMSFPHIKDVLH